MPNKLPYIISQTLGGNVPTNTTKTAQFTPGPWIAERDTARNAYAWKVTGASGVVRDIARLALVDSASQVEANAHLIAAAPAMYAALREAEKHLTDLANYGSEGIPEPLLVSVRSAIAQAEGE